jgi:hypothetical protein
MEGFMIDHEMLWRYINDNVFTSAYYLMGWAEYLIAEADQKKTKRNEALLELIEYVEVLK